MSFGVASLPDGCVFGRFRFRTDLAVGETIARSPTGPPLRIRTLKTAVW
jgi:hypothetical protein